MALPPNLLYVNEYYYEIIAVENKYSHHPLEVYVTVLWALPNSAHFAEKGITTLWVPRAQVKNVLEL